VSEKPKQPQLFGIKLADELGYGCLHRECSLGTSILQLAYAKGGLETKGDIDRAKKDLEADGLMDAKCWNGPFIFVGPDLYDVRFECFETSPSDFEFGKSGTVHLVSPEESKLVVKTLMTLEE
jgi:hypothetical protein